MDPRIIPQRPANQNLVCALMMHGQIESIVWDESQNSKNGTPTASPVPKYPGFALVSGSSQYIDIGTGPTVVKTTAMWVKMDDITAHTDTVIDLNGTDYLTIVNGVLTANGFAAGTQVLYVDGVAAATAITLAKWHHIGITDSTGRDATDLDIGRKDAAYTDGTVAGVRLYSTLLTPSQMKTLYDLERWRYQI